MSAIDERKALERLARATRNLTSGARLGASQPPPEEPEDETPGAPQLTEGEPQPAKTPPPQ